MGKNKDKKKSKGNEPELGKKELKAREAKLAAELEARAAAKVKPGTKHKDHLDRVGELIAIIQDDGTKKKARAAAEEELAGLREEGKKINAKKTKGEHDEEDEPASENPDDDAAIKRRVESKRYLRALGITEETDPDDVPRDDDLAVKAWNLLFAKGHLLTSDAERATQDARLADDAKPEKVKKAKKVEGVSVSLEDGVVTIEEGVVVVDLTGEKKKSKKAEVEAMPKATDEVTVTGDEFATPEDLGPVVEFDGLGRYKILNPATGVAKGYTRVTTFIDCLEDKTMLDKWKLRVLLEGAALQEAATTGSEDSTYKGDLEPWLVTVRDLVHRRDVGLAKLAKADAKGKLEKGSRADLEAAITKEFKSALDNIAHEALELGGAHEKAQKGTDLHKLCELADLEGFKAVIALFDAGSITSSDLEDVRAYVNTMERLGIKVVEVEQMVVDDVAGTAGRLDRVVLFKAPETQRAVRMVGDIKTGRIDFGIGKIGMQLDKYATSEGYDPAEPKVRRDLKLNKTKALLIHLPAGKAECHVYLVDLALAKKGNKLATDVRSWRNEGKRVVDLKADLAALEVA